MNMVSSAYGRISGALRLSGPSAKSDASRISGRRAAISLGFAMALFAAGVARADETISASVTLVADRVVSGVLTVENGVVVDLAGNRLTVGGLAGAGEITDSSSGATPGELWLAISGTSANSTVALTGNLMLVKDGAGTFTASKTGQTYTGGTVVTNGTLKCGVTSSSTPFGAQNSEVAIYDDGVFECNGYDNTKYLFVMAGGLLKSSAQVEGQSSIAFKYTTRTSKLSKVRLVKDSSFDFVHDYGLNNWGVSEIDLGGHTLTASLSNGRTFQLYQTTVKNGTLDIRMKDNSTSYGIFCIRGKNAPYALDATNSTIRLDGSFSTYLTQTGYPPIARVGNFEDVSRRYYTTGARNADIQVFGTYKPTSTYFTGCVMQNGSALDLSGKSGAWSTTSSASYNNTVTFADNATIAVKIGNRHVLSQTPIITWTTAPANLATLKFVRGDADRNYSLEVKEDGVYVKQGLFIYMR